MQKLLKNIRMHLGMSQEELAKAIGVAFATINRWENGRALPNNLAQDRLFELCQKQAIPVCDLVIEKINAAREEIHIEPDRTILYHGSKDGLQGILQPSSRKNCDFGKGFYMGTDPRQPLTLICDFPKSKFYIVSIGLDALSCLTVPADIEWAMLAAYHRGKMEKMKGTAFYQKYADMSKGRDILTGPIANDRMFYVLDNFFLGNITDKALVESLASLELGSQYVAVTQKGCDAIRIEKEIPLSYLEKKCLQVQAEENREKGVSLANQICKAYRREGLFFDEILDEMQQGV